MATSTAESIPGEWGGKGSFPWPAPGRCLGTQVMLCAGSREQFCPDPALKPQGRALLQTCPQQLHAEHHFTAVLPTLLGCRRVGSPLAMMLVGKDPPPPFSDLVLPPKTSMQASTHLCSSLRETVTLRLCPSMKRAARMSAHCTISPRGPPFSTRGLKTSPDSSVRKPIWIKICRDKERGQHWGKGQFGFSSPE